MPAKTIVLVFTVSICFGWQVVANETDPRVLLKRAELAAHRLRSVELTGKWLNKEPFPTAEDRLEYWRDGVRFRANVTLVKRAGDVETKSCAYDGNKHQYFDGQGEVLVLSKGSRVPTPTMCLNPLDVQYLAFLDHGGLFDWSTISTPASWEFAFRNCTYLGKGSHLSLDCHVLQVGLRDGPVPFVKVWLCEARDLYPVKIVWEKPGEPPEEMSVTSFKQQEMIEGGERVSVPTAVEWASGTGADRTVISRWETELLRVNESVPEDLFTLARSRAAYMNDADENTFVQIRSVDSSVSVGGIKSRAALLVFLALSFIALTVFVYRWKWR